MWKIISVVYGWHSKVPKFTRAISITMPNFVAIGCTPARYSDLTVYKVGWLVGV